MTGASALFLRQWVRSPLKTGAVWPSSQRLARVMARAAARSPAGLVVELGAGTGVVTQALLDAGIAPERLRVIERAPAFAGRLRERFPALAVYGTDATRLGDVLDSGERIVSAASGPSCATQERERVAVIVSSLPLVSLSPTVVRAIVRQWETHLVAGGRVVQFSYALWGRPPSALAGFEVVSQTRVWANLPPARVTVFRLNRRRKADQ